MAVSEKLCLHGESSTLRPRHSLLGSWTRDGGLGRWSKFPQANLPTQTWHSLGEPGTLPVRHFLPGLLRHGLQDAIHWVTRVAYTAYTVVVDEIGLRPHSLTDLTGSFFWEPISVAGVLGMLVVDSCRLPRP